MIRRNLPLLALIVSLSFNLGFVGSLAVYRGLGQPEDATALPESAECPVSLRVLSDRLENELAGLRHERAGLTRNLAALIAEPDPDRAEIDQCLDRLSSSGRRSQAVIVNAILTQKEELPAHERAAFCRDVHRCLCEPWKKSGFSSECCTNGSANKQRENQRRNKK